MSGVLDTTVDLLRADDAHAGRARDDEGEAPPVMADAELLKIVFLNLLVNSAQAMKGQGEITITFRGRTASATIVVTIPVRASLQRFVAAFSRPSSRRNHEAPGLACRQ